jgi:adenine-specific DNA-methyltransferase
LYLDSEIGASSKPWAPRSSAAKESWMSAEKSDRLIKAGSCFEIKQGARMGDDVFVVEKSYVLSLPLQEQAYFRPALLNSSIQAGVLNDRYYVFYPHTLGLPPLATEDDLLNSVSVYANDYLLPRKEKLKRRKFKTPTEKWWEMIWPNWQFARKPKLVSKYFGGAGSFAWDENGDFVTIVGHAWLPKNDLGLRIDLLEPFSKLMVAYLNMPETESLMDYLSVRVGGGQLDLSSKYLKNLLVPNPKKVSTIAFDAVLDGSHKNGGATSKELQNILQAYFR